jgi:hypothetical protein
MMDVSVLVVSFFFTILIFKGTGLDYITPYNFSFIISLFCVNVFFSGYSERIRESSGTPLI